MKHIVNNNRGYTLIELLLAMTVFTTVMLVSTIGFIGINRTYTRGMVRKQLSESVQTTTNELTNALRNQPSSMAPETCAPNTCTTSPGTEWGTINFSNACFLWKTGSNDAGLYVAPSSCTNVDVNNLRGLLDSRYTVRSLQVNSVAGASGLYRIRGTFTTAEDDALDLAADPIKCKGSAANVAVATCAAESFNFIVNARGGLEL